ncbi:unnamed protein product [Didymodactylos carnosus]|uniref:Uncharacterized protein n=1 Tax=Didymodactylos carnosus TaxID=1234261 RepID=A0A814SNU6_9BILA|nr:unnamed protein product [Didymodactylos carnosus]CAF1150774.1 unnamed protein product [Didymodactylos carnosus]CAF3816912.1 unnamed protein product [Didymodactylos carnosus]CAF3914332.1 unnamed protein product [Didymodactylos carnosus]
MVSLSYATPPPSLQSFSFNLGASPIQRRKRIRLQRDSIDDYFEEKLKRTTPSISHPYTLRPKSNQTHSKSDHYSDSSDTDGTLLTTKTSADLPTAEIIPKDNYDVFHCKSKHNTSDHAMNEIHHITNTMPSVWSLRNIRQQMNENINVINTEFASYIRIEDAIKTLMHTNQTSISRIRRSITTRLSIDGMQVGEKLKLLFLLVSCPTFSKQQIASKLLPIFIRSVKNNGELI